jgi:hypothetical protein
VYLTVETAAEFLHRMTMSVQNAWYIYTMHVPLSLITGKISILRYEEREIVTTASVVWWSEFLATEPEVPCSILGATRFS